VAELPGPPPSDDALAAGLRGLGPLGVLTTLLLLAIASLSTVIGGLLVLAWAYRSRTPWSALGFVRPASWARTIATGLVFGAALKLLMKAFVMPLLGAPPINAAYHDLAGNEVAALGMLFSVIFGAGFGEETLWRGFLFERLGRLLGTRPWARVTIVLLTSALFGLAHYPVQGIPGVQQATIVGLTFGTIYTITRRLPMLMIAHAAFDVTALAIIYWDLETAVAHWIFK
jgi:membrane protease YdiL (CAAX protease family)